MKNQVVALAGLLLLTLATANRALADSGASIDKLGKKIESLKLKDANGKSWTLSQMQGKKAVVVVFLSFDCPVSTSYSQVLADLARTYAERGVAFIGVATNPDEDAAQAARHAKEYHLPFPIFTDDGFAAADQLKAAITPEAFVLDHNSVLRYRGRIDNGYAARLKRNVNISRHDLRQALDDLLAGQPIKEPATLAVGCPIPREAKGKAGNGSVTYYRDVLPILQSNCQSCHRPGAVGPFALMNYRQAVNWGEDVKEYTQSRKMPPWKPVEGLAYHNDRRLRDHDIALLAAWVDGGMVEGDPKEAPPARQFTDGWQLGQPDLVLSVPGDFHVGPSGSDVFRCFVLPTQLGEDKFVTAVEVRPGNPRVVHHALLFIDGNGQARKLEQEQRARPVKEQDTERGPGYSVAMGVGFLPQGGLGGWAPGQMARYLPPDTGYFLPKGADVVMQLHYHRNGRAERDRTSIGLYFAKKPTKIRFQALTLPGGGRVPFMLNIPAGAAEHHIKGSIWVEHDFDLHTVMPHMHMIGRKITVRLTPPDGQPQTLLRIDDWDYNWQETYILKEPLKVKAGTRLDVDAVYDNSDKNPNNPNSPPKNVRFGEQTTNEMCFVFFGATSNQPQRLRPRFEPLKKSE